MAAPIRFDETGWKPLGQVDDGVWVWHTEHGDGVGLYEFTIPPDLPATTTMADFEARSIEQTGQPFVELEIVEVGGVAAVRRIVKVPQRPSGTTYLGSLTFAFADRSYVLKVQCEERGSTGVREVILTDRRLGGQLGGAADFDDVIFDNEFPSHPVARARQALARLERSVVLDPALAAAPPFPLPPPTRIAEGGVGGGASSSAPQVLGRRCQSGHLNRPDAARCQVDGSDMSQAPDELVFGPRPALGVLQFDDGTRITVDREYRIGRHPMKEDEGDLEPIELAGQQSATVSQSHGEIRLVDWDVQIIDLGSANGTFLWDRETEQWQQLPPHEPVRLVNGTAIAVARRTFVFESSTGVEVPA